MLKPNMSSQMYCPSGNHSSARLSASLSLSTPIGTSTPAAFSKRPFPQPRSRTRAALLCLIASMSGAWAFSIASLLGNPLSLHKFSTFYEPASACFADWYALLCVSASPMRFRYGNSVPAGISSGMTLECRRTRCLSRAKSLVATNRKTGVLTSAIPCNTLHSRGHESTCSITSRASASIKDMKERASSADASQVKEHGRYGAALMPNQRHVTFAPLLHSRMLRVRESSSGVTPERIPWGHVVSRYLSPTHVSPKKSTQQAGYPSSLPSSLFESGIFRRLSKRVTRPRYFHGRSIAKSSRAEAAYSAVPVFCKDWGTNVRPRRASLCAVSGMSDGST